MDLILNLAVILFGFLGLGLAAMTLGVDSRERLQDSHLR
jgi:hypothetical protein